MRNGITIQKEHTTGMRKFSLLSVMAAGLALLSASGVLAALNPGVPNPTPSRDSKILVDLTNPVTVMSDPGGTGGNLASMSTDPTFAAEGSKSVKLDFNGQSGYNNNYFVIPLSTPVDIKGYQTLAMDVFIPDASINNSWYQLDPHIITTLPGDDTMTQETWYGPGQMGAGWNHLIWTLKNGTDTKVTQIAFAGNTGDTYNGPIYASNIRLYKGTFAGLQPDEKLIFGFDNASDASFFTSGDGAPVSANTDKTFISQGAGSLKVDLTGITSGWSNNILRADDWGKTIDLSKATAIHLDFYIPGSSYPVGDWHELGFVVIGDGGEVGVLPNGGGASNSFQSIADQWGTLEIPLTPDNAAKLTNVKGLYLIRNSGDDWTGPIYVDNLRAVFPTATTPAPAAGQ
jgi:hypothetical protein